MLFLREITKNHPLNMFEKLLYHIVALNLWRKKHLSQNTFIIIVAALVGALGGLVSSVLKKLTHLVAHAVQSEAVGQNKFYFYLFLPTLGLVTTVLYVRFFIRKYQFRSGIAPILEKIRKGKSRLDIHNTYSQIITSALTVGMGGSAGLESPAVSSGATLGTTLGRLFGLNYRETTLLLACGGAAGISGAFDSPIAGMIFAIEVLLPTFSLPAVTPLLISSAVASVVSHLLYNQPLFVNISKAWAMQNFWYYVVFAVLAGFYTVYYGYTNERIHKFFGNIKNIYLKALIGGISLGVLIALFPALYGEGYMNIQKLMDGNFSSLLGDSLFVKYQNVTWAIVVYALLTLWIKTIACAVTLSSGGNGGMFGPSVVIGGLMGFIFSYSVNQLGWGHLNVTHFIVVGMAASVSGVMHAPLTGVFLSAEITGGYALIVPLMVVSGIAYFINKGVRGYSIYTKNLLVEGDFQVTANRDFNLLKGIKVKYVLEDDFPVFKSSDIILDQKSKIILSKRSLFAIVDEDNRLLGIATLEQLLEAIYNPEELVNNHTFGDFTQPLSEWVNDRTPMAEVLEIMDRQNLIYLPVVNQEQKYLGFITKQAIFNKYRQRLIKQSGQYMTL